MGTVMKLISAVLFICIGHVLCDKVSYTDYSVYQLIPKDESAVQQLRVLEHNLNGYDFWTPVRTIDIPVDVMVSPALKEHFLQTIHLLNIEFHIKLNNVQQYIDASSNKPNYKNFGFSWDAYYTLEEIYEWLASLSEKYPDKVEVIQAGVTYEGRNITGVKVSFSPNNAKRGVFIESNIHAREWICNAVTTYILNQILTSEDKEFRTLVESFDWYIVPVANPDGYVYSHTTDRFWRKTRAPFNSCYGVDPNRNWGYEWSGDDDECSDIYPGPKAFSEPDTLSLSQYLDSIAKNLIAYIDFHSYSQLLMVPYGYTDEHLDNYNVTVPVGLRAAEALKKRYGTEYTVGDIAETIYVARGNSLDWIKGVHQVPYSYVYELRDQGRYGFVLPPEYIIPTGEETLDSLVVILQAALENPSGK